MSGRKKVKMTQRRACPNHVKHAIEDALGELEGALRELMPVVRGEKEMKFVLASLVDRLWRAMNHLRTAL